MERRLQLKRGDHYSDGHIWLPRFSSVLLPVEKKARALANKLQLKQLELYRGTIKSISIYVLCIGEVSAAILLKLSENVIFFLNLTFSGCYHKIIKM